ASIAPPLLANPLKVSMTAPRAGGFLSGGSPSGNKTCHGLNCTSVDWGMSLGGVSGAALAAGTYPAKFGFSTTATPSCSDFAVFVENVAGAAATTATDTGTFGAFSGSGQGTSGTATINN